MLQRFFIISLLCFWGTPSAFAFDPIHGPIRQMTESFKMRAGKERAAKLQQVLEEFAKTMPQTSLQELPDDKDRKVSVTFEHRLRAVARDLAFQLEGIKENGGPTRDDRLDIALLLAEACVLAGRTPPTHQQLATHARRTYAALTLGALAGLAGGIFFQEHWLIATAGATAIAGTTLTYANAFAHRANLPPFVLNPWIRHRAAQEQSEEMLTHFWMNVEKHLGYEHMEESHRVIIDSAWKLLATDSCESVL